MERIPLHNLFEQYLGIGKINTREEYDAMVAKLEAYVNEHPEASIEEAVREVAEEEDDQEGP